MATLFQRLKSGSKESRKARIEELEHKLHLQDERPLLYHEEHILIEIYSNENLPC
jgi:hypothetical protein